MMHQVNKLALFCGKSVPATMGLRAKESMPSPSMSTQSSFLEYDQSILHNRMNLLHARGALLKKDTMLTQFLFHNIE